MHVGAYVLYVCLCTYDYLCVYVRVCTCVYVCKTKKLMTQWHSDQSTCKSLVLSYFVHIVLLCIKHNYTLMIYTLSFTVKLL